MRLLIVHADGVAVALTARAGRRGRTHVQNAVDFVGLAVLPMDEARVQMVPFLLVSFGYEFQQAEILAMMQEDVENDDE